MKRPCTVITTILCVLACTNAFAVCSVQMTVTPKVLDIDAFYDGTVITATGAAPAESDVILRFLGGACDLHMKERGKALGIMWMNLNSLTFRGVPSVCLVSSALAFESLTPRPEGKAALKSLRLSGIEENASVESHGLDRSTAFNELVKLKQREGLYGEMIGNISYGPVIDGRKSFKAKIPVPSRLSPGTYLVELNAVNNGEIVAGCQEAIKVNLVGFPAMLYRLAFRHAVIYGILATVVALLAGLAIGVVFQSKGAH